MGHYKSNVRDLEFNLFEVLDLEKALATGDFGDLDGHSVREMLDEAARQAEGPLAESFAEADRNPPTFDPNTHEVTLPEPFKTSVRAWQHGEWFRVGLDEHVGGVPAPSMLAWAINELALGAQSAAFMSLAGPIMADILYGIGNEQQRQWAALMIERNWGATMVLTEPDAGSDVGAGRTKAIEQPDGTWHLDGVKRFITNGDTNDLYENLMHLVLARPEGAGPGTKGLLERATPRACNRTAAGCSSPRSTVRCLPARSRGRGRSSCSRRTGHRDRTRTC
jgi:alkylation response protein AidB-like acyl-CoA dehydrogenase